MPSKYLHHHRNFVDLLSNLEEETGIQAALIEKDYWIMHVLYGLTKNRFIFELKGGTSLSKGYNIIHRFSEDIDIHIQPPVEFKINPNPKNTNPKNAEARKDFYDWLASHIAIDGITAIERDTEFDDTVHYRSGGIRLYYDSKTSKVEGLKEGILLEVGFDNVTPNQPITISSWAYDKAESLIKIVDNRAIDITCYHAGYTFVEKLQTIATKFRQEQQDGNPKQNLLRQYYDVAHLLDLEQVQAFIGTQEYLSHKEARFPKVDFEIPIQENEAFLLRDPDLRESFRKRYKQTEALYYKGQPDFDSLLAKIEAVIERL